jgi:hypothetical protein
MKLIHSKIWRWSEIILVFLGLPLLYYFDYFHFIISLFLY